MNLKQQIAALRAEAKSIIDTDGEGLTQERFTLVEQKLAEADRLEAQLALGEKARKQLESIDAGEERETSGPDAGGYKSPLDRFLKSDNYGALARKFPTGIGQGSNVHIEKTNVGSLKDLLVHRKATVGLTSPIAQAQPQEFPLVDLIERPALTLLDLVSRGSMSGDSIRYVQIESVTRNGAIVPEATGDTGTTLADGYKPVSDFETAFELAEAFTYADGYTVSNQLLADHPAFATFMDGELRYSLPALVEDYLLNGSGLAGQPKGILATTGVQEQTYTGASGDLGFITAIRKAVTKVTRLRGGTVTAVLMSPEDDERIDLMRDGEERFYGQGPFQTGPQTIWGRPRVVSEALEPGQVILGDFRQIALLDREGLSIEAFNQHADYARRNLVYVRAELRAAQAIWRPNRLVVVSQSGA